MKKPRHYDAWRRYGVDFCRAHFAGNVTFGASMKEYVDYVDERAERVRRFAVLRGWIELALIAVGTVATLLLLSLA